MIENAISFVYCNYSELITKINDISKATEYDITLTAFVTIYEEVAEEYRQMLPKYVHLAYYKYSNIKYCTSFIDISFFNMLSPPYFLVYSVIFKSLQS